MKLEAATIEAIFNDSLFQAGEDTEDRVEARGIMTNVGFHPQRLESHRDAIRELLLELPDDFHAGKGGGTTFLNACVDRHGRQWTGLHLIMERLVLLGLATGQMRFTMPRDIWEVLPGSMPYVTVTA